jgi:probable F420-dependent oxidoreductase
MRIGVQTFFDGRQQEPLADYVRGVATILEDRDFASVWMSEHVVTFRDYDRAYPYPYADDGVPLPILSEIGMLDPMTALTALACHTSQIRLATGIAILPQRNPVYFAKMGTGIDLLSNGRFVAGLGLGWSGQEFTATGTTFEKRGARMDDYVEVVRTLWQDEESAYTGAHYTLPSCLQLPKPAQRPHPPFFFGGESLPALRRVAKSGQGWVGFRQMPEDLP